VKGWNQYRKGRKIRGGVLKTLGREKKWEGRESGERRKKKVTKWEKADQFA